MARPQKTGLDYFPLDVGFFEDDKIQLVSAEFGIKAEALMLRLLCKIYKEGYFYKWGDDQCLLMSKSMGMGECSKGWISEVILGLVRRRFFDEGCYNQFNVLTSTAIQRRYLEAVKERKCLGMERPYWLLSTQETPVTVVNPPKNGVNPPETLVNPPINPHRTGDKKKGDKKKNGKAFAPPSRDEVVDYFIKNGYDPEIAIRAFEGYHVADWVDSQGNKIRSWKQKCYHVWFKPENKAKPQTTTTNNEFYDE